MRLLWSFDPTESGDGWHTFIGDYILCAYEDGRWSVSRRGTSVASGTSLSLKHAKQIATLVYEFTLKPPVGM